MKIDGIAKNINKIRNIAWNVSCDNPLSERTIPSKNNIEQIFIVECKMIQLVIFPFVFSYSHDVMKENIRTSAR